MADLEKAGSEPAGVGLPADPALAELYEDLKGGLEAALARGDERDRSRMPIPLATLSSSGDVQLALRESLDLFGAELFGALILWILKERSGSALAGHAVSMIHWEYLSRLGISMRDLRWPEEEYEPSWREGEVPECGYSRMSFLTGFLRAGELGYGGKTLRAPIEHLLVVHRYHGLSIARQRAVKLGIPEHHWDEIVRSAEGPQPDGAQIGADIHG